MTVGVERDRRDGLREEVVRARRAESAFQRNNQDRNGLAELCDRFSLQPAERTHITPWNYQRTLPRPAAAAPGFFPLGWFWRRIVP